MCTCNHSRDEHKHYALSGSTGFCLVSWCQCDEFSSQHQDWHRGHEANGRWICQCGADLGTVIAAATLSAVWPRPTGCSTIVELSAVHLA